MRLQDVLFHWQLRAVGHSDLLMTGAKNKKCIVVTHNAQAAARLQDELGVGPIFLPISADGSAMRGIIRPLIIDHYALQLLVDDYDRAHRQLLDRCADRNRELALELKVANNLIKKLEGKDAKKKPIKRKKRR